MINNETSKKILDSLKKENGKQIVRAEIQAGDAIAKLKKSIALAEEALASGNTNALRSVALRPGSLADEASGVDAALASIATLADMKDMLVWQMEQLEGKE